MKTVFADTFYFIALLNSKDEAHGKAIQASQGIEGFVVTTVWVLLELANYLSVPDNRRVCAKFIQSLRDDPDIRVLPADQEQFDRGMDLYAARLDQAWSLTDCMSFVVMRDEGIHEALTGDRHFEQAGFDALLK